jgi:hypothetical protein
LKVSEPAISKKGAIYSGSLILDSSASCIAFGFSSGEEKDNNGGKGYIVPVYNKQNKPVQTYYASVNSLHSGYGDYLFSLPVDAAKGLDYLKKAYNNTRR